jgi:hypothetical protein
MGRIFIHLKTLRAEESQKEIWGCERGEEEAEWKVGGWEGWGDVE